MIIKAECGASIEEGGRAYDYYNMKPGHIVAGSVDDGGWFRFRHDDGTVDMLNGPRICSMEFAKRQGFPGSDNPGCPVCGGSGVRCCEFGRA